MREPSRVEEARTRDFYRVVVPRLLEEHDMSARALAREIGFNQSYLSFVITGRRAPSRKLLELTAEAFGLKPSFFREYRELVVFDRIAQDPALLDEVYELVTRSR